MRANTWFFSILLFYAASCAENPTLPSSASTIRSKNEGKDKPYRILILGDSLTEGYGIPPSEAYPNLLQAKLNANLPAGSQPYEVINGGVTGSTTSGGVSRIGWHMQSPPDFLLVALGGNDGLRGIPPQESKQNLRKIIVSAQQRKVPVMLAGMKLPPNYGAIHLEAFENMFPELADELKIPLLPFLLEGVGGNPKMNLPDRIHPNPQGHQMICQTVFQHLIKHLPKHLP
ncbi:MAG: arylesterase [Opitutae bacterium]|nr:arylesterase [Opitutae bacterium]